MAGPATKLKSDLQSDMKRIEQLLSKGDIDKAYDLTYSRSNPKEIKEIRKRLQPKFASASMAFLEKYNKDNEDNKG